MSSLPPELEPAYKLFLSELSNHTAAMREKVSNALASLEAGTLGDEQLEVLRKSLEHRFHVIRGGAGFFQLEIVRDAATEGEQAFRTGRSRMDYEEALRSTVQTLIEHCSTVLSQDVL